jgi:hypothetical protein
VLPDSDSALPAIPVFLSDYFTVLIAVFFLAALLTALMAYRLWLSTLARVRVAGLLCLMELRRHANKL